tara:strand:- start:676612 stop:676824 length:213 start_codon:yes stop_codon:yes gene_type:complete
MNNSDGSYPRHGEETGPSLTDLQAQEASKLRVSILDGYQDAIQSRAMKFSGDLRKDLKAFKGKNLKIKEG